jgi:tetratricopeptide (TPR) repeat protein
MRFQATLPVVVLLLLTCPLLHALPPRGGARGGGNLGAGNKGGGFVPQSKPNFNKPAQVNRPAAPTTLPHGGGNFGKPSGSMVSRPNVSPGGLIRPGNLPNQGFNRPNIGSGNFGGGNLGKVNIGSGNKHIDLGGKPSNKFDNKFDNKPNIEFKPRIDIKDKSKIVNKDNKVPIIGSGNRPIIGGDRPIIGGDRPNLGINTGNIINRPTINNVNNTIVNQNINKNNLNLNVNKNNYVDNRHLSNYDRYGRYSRYGGWGANGYYYGQYHHLHSNWYHGGWNYWPYNSASWFAAGTAFGWLTSPGQTIVYQNPYYVPTTNVVVNYSQPIPVPVPVQTQVPVEVPVEVPIIGAQPAKQPETLPAPTPAPAEPMPSPEETEKEAQAKTDFDAAQEAFKAGNYPQAQELAEKAITALPGDATLHEFRALTLFAQKKYKEAASAIYAVLAAGPGWDWDTVKALYPNVGTYTTQLRALEDYQKANPNAGDVSFLLAYQYLTLDEKDAAIKQLENAVRVTPTDELSKQLLKMLKPPADAPDRPKAGM